MDAHQLTDIFCEIDDFCNMLDAHTEHYMLTGPMRAKRGPACGLALSEIMTLLIMFQSSRVRDFKNFYIGHLCFYYKGYFPKLPCYERFISLMQRAIFPLSIFTQLKAGKQTGIYYITPVRSFKSVIPALKSLKSGQRSIWRVSITENERRFDSNSVIDSRQIDRSSFKTLMERE